MKEILSDPIWQSVGVFVAIFIAVWLYVIKKKKKELSYSISSTQLISSTSELKRKIDIVWNGSTVNNVHLILIKFINTGNVSIRKEDFDRDIAINFDKSSYVMEYDINEAIPKNLMPKIFSQEHNVQIKPLLLNKGDSLELKLMICDYSDDIIIDCRITGIKDLRNFKKTQVRAYWFLMTDIMVSLIIGILLSLNVTPLMVRPGISTSALIVAYMFFTFLISIVFLFVLQYVSVKKL